MRAPLTGVVVFALGVAAAHADVILSSTALNESLKKMQRSQQTIGSGTSADRVEAWFQLGVAADALTTLLNDEVAEHGSQEKTLIDLALRRTSEIDVAIAYNAGKKKFFYDNAAFAKYVSLEPRGAHAADASFKLIEGEFFQSTASDVAAIERAAERKRQFLRRFPSYAGLVEVHLMLSVDYRDLFHHHQTVGPQSARQKYRDLTRQQLQVLMKRFPDAEQAEIARRMLQRFDAELRGSP